MKFKKTSNNMKIETQNNINNDGSFDRQVPYDYVKGKIETRFYKVFLSEKREKIQCTECGKQTDELNWFMFCSSDESWSDLAGNEGYYANCPACDIMVYSATTRIS